MASEEAMPKWVPIAIVVGIVIAAAVAGGVLWQFKPWESDDDDDNGNGGDGGDGSSNNNPTARAEPDEQSVIVNDRVNVSAFFSIDPDGDTLLYNWDFNRDEDGDGDGVTDNDFSYPHGSRQRNASTVYYEVGDYYVLLNVSDGNGGYDTDTCLIHVLEDPAAGDPPLVLISCTGVNGTILNPDPYYILNVVTSTPEDVPENFTVMLFNLTDQSTMDVYYENPVMTLDGTNIDYTDTDFSGTLSVGDFFRINPSAEFPAPVGDYFALTHTKSPDFPITYVQLRMDGVLGS